MSYNDDELEYEDLDDDGYADEDADSDQSNRSSDIRKSSGSSSPSSSVPSPQTGATSNPFGPRSSEGSSTSSYGAPPRPLGGRTLGARADDDEDEVDNSPLGGSGVNRPTSSSPLGARPAQPGAGGQSPQSGGASPFGSRPAQPGAGGQSPQSGGASPFGTRPAQPAPAGGNKPTSDQSAKPNDKATEAGKPGFGSRSQAPSKPDDGKPKAGEDKPKGGGLFSAVLTPFKSKGDGADQEQSSGADKPTTNRVGDLRKNLPYEAGGKKEGDAPKSEGENSIKVPGVAALTGAVRSLGGVFNRGKNQTAEEGGKPEAKPGPKADAKPEASKEGGIGALAGRTFGGLAGGKKPVTDEPAEVSAVKKADKKDKAAAPVGAVGRKEGERPPLDLKNLTSGLVRSVRGIFGSEESAKSATKKQRNTAPKIKEQQGMSLDRKLDLLGVGLVLVSGALLLSGLSARQGAITEWFNTLFNTLVGWGAVAIPIAGLMVGIWLIVRHFGDDAPTVDMGRVFGIGLLYVSGLVSAHFIYSFQLDNIVSYEHLMFEIRRTWLDPSIIPAGGGMIGGYIYLLLVSYVGEILGFTLALFGVLVGMMFIADLSLSEIAIIIVGLWRSFRDSQRRSAERKAVVRAQRIAQRQAQIAALTPPATQIEVTRPVVQALGAGGEHALPAPDPSRAIPITMGGRTISASLAQQQGESVVVGAVTGRAPRSGLGGLFGRVALPKLQPAPAKPAPVQATKPTQATTPLGARLGGLTNRMGIGKNATPSTPPPAADPVATTQTAPAPATAVSSVPTAPVGVTAPVPKPEDGLPSATVAPVVPSATPTVGASAQERTARLNAPHQAQPAVASSPAFTTDQAAISRTDAYRNAPTPPAVVNPVALRPAPPSVNIAPAPKAPKREWKLPDVKELLNEGQDQDFDRQFLVEQARIIEETLRSFGAPGRVVEINTGPVITQYGVEPDYLQARSGKKNRVKVSAIAQLDRDLQLALGARSIRIEAPVPGKGYVGIEIPNAKNSLVSLLDVMTSEDFIKITNKSRLALALGQSVDGTPTSANLASMPHCLIAGTTGSGKSVCINAIICSLLATNTPDQLKFIMVDPKRVELTGYNGIPHLVAPVVVELERIVGVLKWVTREMDERYRKFSQSGARNIEDFNKHLVEGEEQMPYVVVIVDELADLMMLAPEETERAVSRIAALARATGIHLVIATQRPSVDVVTGLIKANFPARIAFAVAGSVDSRVILDQPGAERLLGRGDMLYLSGDSPAPLRLQGVYVSDEEIDNIVRYWKQQAIGYKPAPVKGISPLSVDISNPPRIMTPSGASEITSGRGSRPDFIPSASASPLSSEFWDDDAPPTDTSGEAVDEDTMYKQAVEMVRLLNKASVSLLQRRLRIGYTRAARLIELMEERGVVGPQESGSKPREVLVEK